ncbi:hypothetical protein B0H13DRAFT_2327443 [Mycena leptocephala]|nr:hypothetical protein B0H13DRAFT_2327443 [Mycena leptocephala]
MALCTGCGRKYRYLASTGDLCGRCQDRDAHRNSDWNAAIAHVSNAIANPPHPRDPGQYIPPAQPPLTNNPELQERARIALASVSNAHANAVANAVNPDLVAKSKIRGVAANQLAVPRIHIRVTLQSNQFKCPSSEKNSGFLTIIRDFYENVPFYKVVAGLVAAIDLHYVDQYGTRIQVSDVMFQYASCGAVLDSAHTSGTLGDLWRQSTGVRVAPKERKNSLLDLHAVVNYPPVISNKESEYDSEITFVTGSKRKATSLASSSVKRLALVPAGANHYRSTVERTEDSFLVSRIDCTRDGAGVVVWTETSVSTEVSVRQDSSASGNTKQMSILTFERRQYAAKSFYDIGGRPPTPQDNIFHLKAELLCQKQVAHCLTRFQEQAKAHGVSIADLRAAQSFILHVTSGPRKHHAWLVDPLLSTTNTIKFSGTDVAGSNSDLFGATCDALAHFSLEDSEGYLSSLTFKVLLLCIKEPHLVHGVRGSDELVLFDIMQHTRDGDSNIGDKGLTGIEEFKRQHKCNSISFNHILGIEAGEETTVYGPFDTKLATLRYSRRKDSKDVLLLDFSKRKQSDEIDYPTQEVTRFADAKDLMEQFETLLEAKHFSLESNPESTDSTYSELEILQASAEARHRTWLYTRHDLRSELIDTKNITDDAKNRKFHSLLEAFSHFVYEKSGRSYVYHRFLYFWLDPEEGGGPFIFYFQTSSTAGDTCYDDGGKLGIEDFRIEHECDDLCTRLGLIAL